MPYKDRRKQLEAMRRWGAANPRTEYKREYQRAYERPGRNPLHRRAHHEVERAVANGTLSKERCLFCGAEKVEAHHHDYSLPLVVTWLCRKHHRLAHRTGW